MSIGELTVQCKSRKCATTNIGTDYNIVLILQQYVNT